MDPLHTGGLTGLGTGTIELRMEGDDRNGLAKSAAGNATLVLLNGDIATGDEVFRFKQLTAAISIAGRQLSVSHAAALTSSGKWDATGTVSFDRTVQLSFSQPEKRAQELSGTLAPVVVPDQRASK